MKSWKSTPKSEFGGAFLANKRKSKRPLSNKESMHLVLRLRQNLPGLFEPRDVKLKASVYKIAQKYDVKIYRLIFNHSHLHAVLLLKNRASYLRFIREVTSFMVRHFTMTIGVRFKNIFLHRPYSRIVAWGRAYRALLNYMKKNEVESGVKQG
ncbi:MAG: hypothetical protein A2Z20_05090, partial [Bdellovibrionales bacterium RBG_16_40_8]